jgi:hypothetical protein
MFAIAVPFCFNRSNDNKMSNTTNTSACNDKNRHVLVITIKIVGCVRQILYYRYFRKELYYRYFRKELYYRYFRKELYYRYFRKELYYHPSVKPFLILTSELQNEMAEIKVLNRVFGPKKYKVKRVGNTGEFGLVDLS